MNELLQHIGELDTAVVTALATFRTEGLVDAALWVSELASPSTVIGAGLIMTVIFVYYRNWKYLIGMLFSLLGTYLINELIKHVIARPRPMDFTYIESGFSFPSAHTAEAAALYLFLAYCSLWFAPPGKWRYEMCLFFGLIIAAVGVSRIFLGVHYPTDVLGGLIVGMMVTSLAIRYMERA